MHLSNLPTPGTSATASVPSALRGNVFYEDFGDYAHVTPRSVYEHPAKKPMLETDMELSPESTYILTPGTNPSTPESSDTDSFSTSASVSSTAPTNASVASYTAQNPAWSYCAPLMARTSAVYSHMLPTSLPSVCPAMVEDLLHVLRMPMSCTTLCGCILDSLSRDFYRKWIRSIPMDAAIHPELVVMAALSLAMKFAEDEFYSPKLLTDVLNDSLGRVLDFEAGYTFPTVDNLIDLELRILRDLDYNVAELLRDDGLQKMREVYER